MELPELLDRCRQGNSLAWEELVRRYQGRVFGLALHYAHDVEEARDLAQEVFVRVFQRLGSFRPDEPFLPWLLRVARNLCIDQIRRTASRPPGFDIPADEALNLRAAGQSPEEAWEAGSRQQLVHRALRQVGEAHREILLLKEIQGLKLEEIAALLDLPLGTVKSRSSRARVELAETILRLAPEAGVAS